MATGRFMALVSALAMAAAAPAAATTITTQLDGSIENDGVMFDVSVLGGALSLQGIGINAAFGTFDYAVYYRTGGVGSAQNTPGAWTLLNSFAAVTTAGAGAVTQLDITDLSLAAGATYGFYVTDTQNAFSLFYSDSSGAVGDVLASDGALAVRVGYGVTYPFGDVAEPRAFNGALTYAAVATAVPEPASWAMMIAGLGIVGGAMRRRRTRIAFA